MLRTVTTTAALLVLFGGVCSSSAQDEQGSRPRQRVSTYARQAPLKVLEVPRVDPDAELPMGGRLALQNSFFLGELPEGMHNDIITVGGGWVRADKGNSVEWYVSRSDSDIRSRIERFRAMRDLDEGYAGILVLDIEHPIHPQDWGSYQLAAGNSGDFERLMEATRRRVEITKETFPNARIGLYGLGMPDSRGIASKAAYQRSMEGYLAAGRLGVYDKLEFAVPPLYMRFGPSDLAHRTIPAYTQLGVESARQLKRSDDSDLEVLPYLSLIIGNGASAHHKEPAPVADVVGQLKLLRDLQVDRWAIWVGREDNASLGTPVDRAVATVWESYESSGK